MWRCTRLTLSQKFPVVIVVVDASHYNFHTTVKKVKTEAKLASLPVLWCCPLSDQWAVALGHHMYATIFRSHLLWEVLFKPGGKLVKLGWLNTLCSASWRGALINSACTLDGAGCDADMSYTAAGERLCPTTVSFTTPKGGESWKELGVWVPPVGERLVIGSWQVKKKILMSAVKGPFFFFFWMNEWMNE